MIKRKKRIKKGGKNMHVKINKDLILLRKSIISIERTDEGEEHNMVTKAKHPDDVHIVVESRDGSEEFDVKADFDYLEKVLVPPTAA